MTLRQTSTSTAADHASVVRLFPLSLKGLINVYPFREHLLTHRVDRNAGSEVNRRFRL